MIKEITEGSSSKKEICRGVDLDYYGADAELPSSAPRHAADAQMAYTMREIAALWIGLLT